MVREKRQVARVFHPGLWISRSTRRRTEINNIVSLSTAIFTSFRCDAMFLCSGEKRQTMSHLFVRKVAGTGVGALVFCSVWVPVCFCFQDSEIVTQAMFRCRVRPDF